MLKKPTKVKKFKYTSAQDRATKYVKSLLLKKNANCKYELWMDDAMIQVAAEGGSKADMCLALGLRSKSTIDNWCKADPQFKEAYEYAKLVSQAWWEKVGRDGTTGDIDKFNQPAWATNVNNKFSDDFKRTEQPPTTSTTYNIGSITNVESLTLEELDAQIARLEEKTGRYSGTREPITIEATVSPTVDGKGTEEEI
jgi:hypothetical protein